LKSEENYTKIHNITHISEVVEGIGLKSFLVEMINFWGISGRT
jgi:hypothetical protein